MSDRPWHKRFHADAITGYMGLSLEERGAYSTLLDYLYDRGEPLAGNIRMLAGFLDVSVRKAHAVIDALVTKGKLVRLSDGRITNHRFEKEVQNDAKTSDHMAEIGSAGGRQSAETRKKPNKNKQSSNSALDTRSSYPEAIYQSLEPERKKKEDSPSLALGDVNGFEEWYRTYPRRIDRRDAERAYTKTIAQISPKALLEITAKFASESQFKEAKFIPHPATWLNKGRWRRDETPVTSNSSQIAFEERARQLFGDEARRHIKNFHLTFGDNYERAADRLNEFAKAKNPTMAAASWFFDFGEPGCECGLVG